MSAYFEAKLLAGFQPAEAQALFGRPGGTLPAPERFTPQPAAEVGRRYLERFRFLETLSPAPGRSPMTYLVVSSLADLHATVENTVRATSSR